MARQKPRQKVVDMANELASKYGVDPKDEGVLRACQEARDIVNRNDSYLAVAERLLGLDEGDEVDPQPDNDDQRPGLGSIQGHGLHF